MACCSASYQGAFERLEPDEVKVSSPVLRRGGGGNASSLSDPAHQKDEMIHLAQHRNSKNRGRIHR